MMQMELKLIKEKISMFLSMLNEKEQKNFMELAQIAMSVDGKIDESELQVMDVYRRETTLLDYEVQNKKESDLITAFQASTKKVRKAVIIELAGVLDADETIESTEESWILNLGTEWGFRTSEIRRMVRWTQDFNDLLAEGYEIILK